MAGFNYAEARHIAVVSPLGSHAYGLISSRMHKLAEAMSFYSVVIKRKGALGEHLDTSKNWQEYVAKALKDPECSVTELAFVPSGGIAERIEIYFENSREHKRGHVVATAAANAETLAKFLGALYSGTNVFVVTSYQKDERDRQGKLIKSEIAEDNGLTAEEWLQKAGFAAL